MEHISIRIWYSLMEHIDQEKNVPIYLFTCWPVWGSPAMESCSGHTSAWRWSSSSWCLVCRFVRSSGATSRSTITRSSMRICYSHRCKKNQMSRKHLQKKQNTTSYNNDMYVCGLVLTIQSALVHRYPQAGTCPLSLLVLDSICPTTHNCCYNSPCNIIQPLAFL